MPKRFFVTTPIYYVNSVPHIGTALTTLASDVTSRYQKMRGLSPYFLTGTDENGLKVLEAAQAAGSQPQDFVAGISEEFKRIWAGLYIDFDGFIRTTEPRHIEGVRRAFQVLRDAGHIYVGKYEGWYDVASETFYKESDLVDGKSPDGNEVRWVEEENYFFRLSEFEQPLLEHIARNPNFILPESRRNEVVSFIKQGLRDTCISRANQGWGITVPGDEGKVVYVWFDALLNYLTATGWPDAGYEQFWPPDVQWMGKDILTRFHATLWPAMIMALGLPLPYCLIGHAWMTMGGEKISKSKGNVVAPMELAEDLAERSGCALEVAVDAVRYYMAAAMPFETDGTFTMPEFDRHYNGDLANDLGNALNRSLAMAHRFVGGEIPGGSVEPEAMAACLAARGGFEEAIIEFRVDRAADSAWSVIRFLNKYIDTRAPWALAKAGDPSLPAVVRSMLLCLRTAEGLVRPIMPKTADAISIQLNLNPTTDWSSIGSESSLPAGVKLGEPTPIFPRLETKTPKEPREAAAAKPAKAPPPPPEPTVIGIEDFMKVQLKVGRVLEAEPLEGSDKLLKLQVVIGDEHRQIVAGIRAGYDPLDLIGRQVVVVANLKPAILRGTESQGMLLAAVDEEGKAILLQPDRDAPEGATVR